MSRRRTITLFMATSAMAVGALFWIDVRTDQSGSEENTNTSPKNVVDPAGSFLAATSEYARFAAAGAYARLEDAGVVRSLLDRFAQPESPAESFAHLVLTDRVAQLERPHNPDPPSAAQREFRRLRALAETDPAAAIAGVLAIGDEHERLHTARTILPAAAESTPAAALDAALSLGLPTEHLLGDLQSKVLEAAFAADFGGTKERVLSADFPLHRDHLDVIADALVAGDPDAAIDWVTKRIPSNQLRKRAADEVIRKFAWKDPQKGADFLASDSTFSDRDLSSLAWSFTRGWAHKDAPALLDWGLAEAGRFRFRGLALGSWVTQKMEDSPEEVFSLLESPDLEATERPGLVRTGVALARSDLPRYLALVAQTPGTNPTATLAGIARSLVEEQQFGDAIMILDALDASDESTSRSIQEAVSNITQADPQSAAEWVATFADPDARAVGVRNVVDAWARIDPAAATAYARTFEPGTPDHAQASIALAERKLSYDPEGALRWFANVTDPPQRERFLTENIGALSILAPEQIPALTEGASDNVLERLHRAVARRDYLLGKSPD
ncbi:hypothetical protein BH23VER1_BH23VER1_24080 [soil metagenome]